MVFEDIKLVIMADPMNAAYTQRGIPPLFKASPNARIVIVGQAPGRRAEETRTVWNDLSGDRLREWMGVSRQEFYSSDRIAHMPMDFYYPGKGRQGTCRPAEIRRKVAPALAERDARHRDAHSVGSHAQRYYLAGSREKSRRQQEKLQNYLPRYLLVHPSPLNIGWFKQPLV